MIDNLERINAIKNAIRIIKGNLSQEKALKLSDVLISKNGKIVDDSDLSKIGISPKARRIIIDQLKCLKDEASMFAFAFALWSISYLPIKTKVEVCWTGPTPVGNIRLTEPALQELIASARTEIIIMDYLITSGPRRVLSKIEERSMAGVSILFLLDRVEEKESFLRWVRQLKGPVQIFSRPEDIDDPASALHAKCIIVDRCKGLFGSANLTSYAMVKNIELGILIEDETLINEVCKTLDDYKKRLRLYPSTKRTHVKR